MENENRVKRLSTTKTPKLLDEAEKRSSFKQSQNGAARKLLGIEDEDKGRYTDVHEDGDLRFGTAEAPELFHINRQIDSLEKKQDRIRGRLKYESVTGKSLLGKEVDQLRKKRLIFIGKDKNVGELMAYMGQLDRQDERTQQIDPFQQERRKIALEAMRVLSHLFQIGHHNEGGIARQIGHALVKKRMLRTGNSLRDAGIHLLLSRYNQYTVFLDERYFP